LNGSNTLSGYAWTESGEPLVFSVLVNGYSARDSHIHDAVDALLEDIVRP